MFIVEQYALAVALCIVTMLCWGSWANTQKLAGTTWRFELFYWDYVLGVLLAALIFAFTLGSTGAAGRPFLDDLRQATPAVLGSAFVGGIVFNAANILLVAAIALAGLAVAFPVGIGMALVLGVAGGMIWAVGMTLSIIGVAGPAISYGLGQGATMVAAAWGVPVILDPAPAPDGGLPAALLRNVTCLKPNESEAERLTGIPVGDPASAEQAARALQELGPRTVIITLGSQGAIVVDEAAVHHVPAYRVAAVDTAAAGDAFTGALAAAVGAGAALVEAVRRAAAAGAIAATRMAAQPSLPRQAEWEAFIANQTAGRP
jgi:hypothetical protein